VHQMVEPTTLVQLDMESSKEVWEWLKHVKTMFDHFNSYCPRRVNLLPLRRIQMPL
jgi:hypothetical protein